MTCRRSPCTFSSRVIGRSSPSGPLQGVVTLGSIGQMALTLSGHKCQHYSDSVQTSRARECRASLIPDRVAYSHFFPWLHRIDGLAARTIEHAAHNTPILQ